MAAKKNRVGKRRRARSQRLKKSHFGGTVPRSPARLVALLARYSRVKRLLVAYLRARCEGEIRQRAARDAKSGDDPELSLIQATEDVLHGWPQDAGDEPHIIDSFLAAQPGLNAADRRMARQWKDLRRSVFRIDRRKGRRLRMHNLVDDLDYQVLISGGADDGLESFAPGAFLSAVIVPLMNVWTLSGTQTILGEIDSRIAYGLAAKLAMLRPADFFRNPEHVERSREAGRRYHDRFIDFFGQSWVVGTPREIEDAHRQLIIESNRLAVAKNRASAARLEGMKAPTVELPKELLSAESVGMVSHPEQGLFFLAEFRSFLESFAEPKRAGKAGNRRRVLKYLEDASIPPAVFEMVAGADPDKASETMRRVLRDPHFDWRRDGDLLLREHKPSHFERPPLPSTLALSTEMVEGQRFLQEKEDSAGSRS